MARMTDQELAELRTRVLAALGSGAFIGNANSYLLNLIEEVQSLRKAQQVPKPSIGVLHVGEMEVRRVEPPVEVPTVAPIDPIEEEMRSLGIIEVPQVEPLDPIEEEMRNTTKAPEEAPPAKGGWRKNWKKKP